MKKTAFTTTFFGCRTDAQSRLKVRSMVGLLPLCATTVVEKYQRESNPENRGTRHETAGAVTPSHGKYPCRLARGTWV